ncbi:FIST signal transduction protein [Pseudonocardia charpentierae]|uniref:FIST N-terminal domain-containing protein n=1 Tax=Pseudonocardia charpentierae TaxID=3075545 RepID=A0ABU2NHK4_9PSEU|nr:FIST N-terminal domain-containing protein [Pseudonocardia sp. DSM 45834]MDT0352089.1 FIST N-terminal domain-containing protein [Pseudonocardia sp. DSM 45834]
MSGDPTAGLVPAAPVVPDVGTCRFGDGLAIGPDLEGAAEVALAQALAPLDGIAPDLLCVFVAAGVPARIEAVEAAARQVMSTCGARTTIGATAAGVCADGRGVDHGPAVAVWAATLPGARLRAFRPDARSMPAVDGDARAAALFVDPHTFPLTGFLPHTGALPVVGGLASARGGPGSNRLFLDGEVHAHGAVGLLVAGDVTVGTAVSQGCRPTGPPMTVTRAERNVLYELAGAPALQRLSEVVSAHPLARRRATARGLQLGLVVDEYVDVHPRDAFLVRGILDADEATGAVVVGDVVEVGRTVRFQLRDAGTAAEDLALLLSAPAQGPRGALLFSCAERRALLGSPDRDVRAVRDRLGGAAVAGMVAAGEIGPVGGRNHLHGHSAAVLTFG